MGPQGTEPPSTEQTGAACLGFILALPLGTGLIHPRLASGALRGAETPQPPALCTCMRAGQALTSSRSISSGLLMGLPRDFFRGTTTM